MLGNHFAITSLTSYSYLMHHIWPKTINSQEGGILSLLGKSEDGMADEEAIIVYMPLCVCVHKEKEHQMWVATPKIVSGRDQTATSALSRFITNKQKYIFFSEQLRSRTEQNNRKT